MEPFEPLRSLWDSAKSMLEAHTIINTKSFTAHTKPHHPTIQYNALTSSAKLDLVKVNFCDFPRILAINLHIFLSQNDSLKTCIYRGSWHCINLLRRHLLPLSYCVCTWFNGLQIHFYLVIWSERAKESVKSQYYNITGFLVRLKTYGIGRPSWEWEAPQML